MLSGANLHHQEFRTSFDEVIEAVLDRTSAYVIARRALRIPNDHLSVERSDYRRDPADRVAITTMRQPGDLP